MKRSRLERLCGLIRPESLASWNAPMAGRFISIRTACATAAFPALPLALVWPSPRRWARRGRRRARSDRPASTVCGHDLPEGLMRRCGRFLGCIDLCQCLNSASPLCLYRNQGLGADTAVASSPIHFDKVEAVYVSLQKEKRMGLSWPWS